jgi:predicted ATPase/uncharacterized membrane protein
MDVKQFREKVQAYRRPTGHSQQELADALSIQRQVLARKLSDNSPAHFTHGEVKQIIKTLAAWEALNSRSEAFELLALMDLRPATFSPAEWETPPLAKLEKDAAESPWPRLLRSRPPSAEAAQPHPLPVPLTGLVGREWLVSRACERLLQSQVRLLTLLGPGGIGKTRLALETGRRLLGQFAQGVFFVDLSSLTDPAQLLLTLGQTFRLTSSNPTEIRTALKEYLATRQVLLILDNFEQILPAAEVVSELLTAAPGLKILVTSRAVLQIYGETELGVPPLELPDPANLPAAEDFAALEQFEAIQLFVARAQAVSPTFKLSMANFADVARLCVLLEGWPLSIELAAARVKLMPLPFLIERLSQSKLETLSRGGRNLPERQKTLRATLDWSYALLDSAARQLFTRLGIFKGSFDLAAVAQVCYAPAEPQPADLLEKLSDLVDQSLLKPLEGVRGDLRFTMLETMREYALQNLREAEELEGLEARYRLYYLELAEKLTVDFYMDPEDRLGLTALVEQDFDNFLTTQSLSEPPVEVQVEKESEPAPASKRKTQPVQVEGLILIERPVEEVFDYIAHGENWPQWNSLIKECRPLEPGPGRAGATYFAISSLLGRRQEHTVLISEYIPNQLIELHTMNGSAEVSHRLRLSREGSHTRLSFTTTNNIGQIFRLTRPVLTRIIRKGIEIQLNNLKAVLEKHPVRI